MDDIFTFEAHDPKGKVKLALPPDVQSYARFSPCNRYRYELHRRWKLDETIKTIMFLMMNPSTATQEVDDPTVRKCRAYADRWGYNHLIVANIMAYRATHPGDLLTVDDPQGPANLMNIVRILCGDSPSSHEPRGNFAWDYPAPLLICAWGSIPKRLAFAEEQVMKLIKHREPHVLRLNKSGRPWHPLYLPNYLLPVKWIIT